MTNKNTNFIKKNLRKSSDRINKLNLCCGADYREGWVNADIESNKEKDVALNLEELPLPFEDNTFDYIFSCHTLEHVRGDLVLLMTELWRILKPNAILEIRVPHFSHYSSLSAFGHHNVFSINHFLPFIRDGFGFIKLEKPLFKKIRGTLRHQRKDNGQKILVNKGFYYYFSKMIDNFANANTNLCEKIWCHWVGGFQEMQIVLEKIPQELIKDYLNKLRREIR